VALRILVIEDNPANLELMTYLLNAFGHTTLSACDGIEGLELAEREMPDLILCDIQLPRSNGFEVMHKIKEHPLLRSIVVVAITAFAMVGDRDKILAAGFDGYIAKPIAPEIFVNQVETFMHQCRPAEPGKAAKPAQGEESGLQVMDRFTTIKQT
jgi:CheY-like chemotaxis protein